MEISDRYYGQLEEKGLSGSTIRQHKQSMSRFIRWFHTMPELKTGDSSGWQKVIRKDIRQFRRLSGKGLYANGSLAMKKCLSVGTINNTVKHLKQFFAWLLDQNLIPDNPCDEIELIPEDRLKAKWMDKQVERRLINEMRVRSSSMYTCQRRKGIREKAIIQFLMFTGVRVQELCEVKLSDIILGERSGSVAIRGKGNKQRTIPVIQDLRDTLREYRSIHTPKGEYLFDTERVDHLIPKTVRDILQKYARYIGIDKHHTCYAIPASIM
jgi:site-specific recombinase XerD